MDVAAAPSAASERYMCASVLRLLRVRVSYVCERPHTAVCALASSYQYVCVDVAGSLRRERAMLLYMCPDTTLCVLILLYVSAYYYICAQALSAARKRRVAASLYVS